MGRSSVGTLLLVVLAGLVASPGLADPCDDLTPFGSCPPEGGVCVLGPDPDSCAQDCSTCTAAFDDDRDCVLDEEILNGEDDDGDGLIDEDISCLNSCDPINYGCTAQQVAGDGIPWPVEESLTLPARLAAWQCDTCPPITPPQPLREQEMDVTLEPLAGWENPMCGGFLVSLTLGPRGGDDPWFHGPAGLVLSRRWESLEPNLISGAEGNVQVFRYTLRADLERVVDFASLPEEIRIPCSQDSATRPHTFFYGYLDLALDSLNPADPSLQRRALALAHAPGRLSHAEVDETFKYTCDGVNVSRRPLEPCSGEAHDEAGWYVVAPEEGFTFERNLTQLDGVYRAGKIRSVPSAGDPLCMQESSLCESHFTDRPPAPACELIDYRHARFCAQWDAGGLCVPLNISAHTKCDTVPDQRVAFLPVGAWNRQEFPANMELTLFEGGLSCLGNFTAYWYGCYTHLDSAGYESPSADPPYWLGPEDALDMVDNQTVDQQAGLFTLIGSLHWFMEGQPGEQMMPLQMRTMYFFPDQNPDIPSRAPCVASAVAEPPALLLCEGDDLELTGAPSRIENCCQCGGLEYRWSVWSLNEWEVVRDWSTEAGYSQSPGPPADARYLLEVRCSTSRRACVDSAEVVVTVVDCTCVATSIRPIQGLRAVKAPNQLDVLFTWQGDTEAMDGYNVAFVLEKEAIPACAACPGSMPVTNCQPTGSSINTTCAHVGAIPDPLAPLFFYNVKGVCQGEEAPE